MLNLALSVAGTVLGWMIAQLIVVVLMADQLSNALPQNRETQLLLVAMGVTVGVVLSNLPKVNRWLVALALAAVGTLCTLSFFILSKTTPSLLFLSVDFLRWASACFVSVATVTIASQWVDKISA